MYIHMYVQPCWLQQQAIYIYMLIAALQAAWCQQWNKEGIKAIIMILAKRAQLRLDAPKCDYMRLDAPRCAQMRLDAPTCAQMHPDALRCAQLRLDAPRCVSATSATSYISSISAISDRHETETLPAATMYIDISYCLSQYGYPDVPTQLQKLGTPYPVSDKKTPIG